MVNSTEHHLISEKIFIAVRQFVLTLAYHLNALDFLKTYRPWTGLMKHRWASIIVSILALLVGVDLVRTIVEIVRHLQLDLSSDANNQGVLLSSFDLSKFNWMFLGAKKYMVLIILEIFIFHFVRRTLEIRIGRKLEHSLAAFLQAEKRMMIVSLRAWISETIVRTLVNVVLGLLGISFLKNGVGLLIQCYFLGYVLLDNYLECYRYKVGEAERITRTVAGVAIGVGIVAFILMKVPIIGFILATMVGAVTATIAMEKLAPTLPLADAVEEN